MSSTVGGAVRGSQPFACCSGLDGFAYMMPITSFKGYKINDRRGRGYHDSAQVWPTHRDVETSSRLTNQTIRFTLRRSKEVTSVFSHRPPSPSMNCVAGALPAGGQNGCTKPREAARSLLKSAKTSAGKNDEAPTARPKEKGRAGDGSCSKASLASTGKAVAGASPPNANGCSNPLTLCVCGRGYGGNTGVLG